MTKCQGVYLYCIYIWHFKYHFSHPFLGTYEVVQFLELGNLKGTPFQSGMTSIPIPSYHGMETTYQYHTIPTHTILYHAIPYHSTSYQGLSDALKIPARFWSFLQILVDSRGIKFGRDISQNYNSRGHKFWQNKFILELTPECSWIAQEWNAQESGLRNIY